MGKRKNTLVLAALASGVAALGLSDARAGGKADAPSSGGVAAVASPAALLEGLRPLVHIDPTISGQRLVMTYHLRDEPQHLDFDVLGLVGPEVSTVRGYGWGASVAEVAATDEDTGLLLHKVPLKGDFELECDFFVRCLDKDRSSFAFVVGYDAKTKKCVGARWGQQLVVADGHRASAEQQPFDMGPYQAMRRAVIKIVRKGHYVTLFLNGTRRDGASTTIGDGRFGLMARNIRVGFARLTVTGTPDLEAANARPEKR